jgi:hypothetical protein
MEYYSLKGFALRRGALPVNGNSSPEAKSDVQQPFLKGKRKPEMRNNRRERAAYLCGIKEVRKIESGGGSSNLCRFPVRCSSFFRIKAFLKDSSWI